MLMGNAFRALGVLLVLVPSVAALADDAIPVCPDLDGSALPIMNSTVADWKHSEDNQWRHRARIRGTITDLYSDHSGHHNFGIKITDDADKNPNEAVEVIYNEDFGPVPALSEGMTVEACGDFILDRASQRLRRGPPLGAIIHWVHKNPKGKGHPSGYLWIDGTLCGQDAEHAGPKRTGPSGRARANRPRSTDPSGCEIDFAPARNLAVFSGQRRPHELKKHVSSAER